MNWLKRIFCSQEKFNEHIGILPEVSNIATMPKVKPPKPDISEPVYAMVKSMFDRPHTWKIEREITSLPSNSFSPFHVKDIKTGVEFKVFRFSSSYGNRVDISWLSWVTDQEGQYLCNSLETMHRLKMKELYN